MQPERVLYAGATVSVYGAKFDRTVKGWALIENEHDRQHPDRGQCGGVGACSMMYAANVLEQEMIEALDEWRKRKVAP